MAQAPEDEAAERRHRAGSQGVIRLGAETFQNELEAGHVITDGRQGVEVHVEEILEGDGGLPAALAVVHYDGEEGRKERHHR